jgi:hypothetical protein
MKEKNEEMRRNYIADFACPPNEFFGRRGMRISE